MGSRARYSTETPDRPSTLTLAAIFDRDPAKVGRRLGGVTVSDSSQLRDLVSREKIVVAVLAVPAASAQQAASDLVAAGVRIIFNYSQALLDVPAEVRVLTSNPAAQLVAALSPRLTTAV